MSALALTPQERRALQVLLAVLVVGGSVQMYKRWRPDRVPGYRLTVSTRTDAPQPAPVSTPAVKLTVGIDPNRAPQEDLELLPGIGPGLARRIIATRKEQPYAVPSDLLRVQGIGPRSVERLTPYLRFP